MRAFHNFRYEKSSGGTRSPQLVLRAFHNLRLISSAALSLMASAHAAPSVEPRRPATVVCTSVLESVDGATNSNGDRWRVIGPLTLRTEFLE